MLRRIRDLTRRLRGQGVGAVLARGASVFLAIQVAGIGISFGVQVLLARSMGPEHYGTYAYALSWLMVLLLPGRAGLDTASIRFIASYMARKDWGLLRGYLRTASVTVVCISLLVGAATAGIVALLGGHLTDAMRSTFYVVALGLPIYAALQVGSFALRGFQKVAASVVPTSIVQPSLMGLGALLLVLAAPGALDAPRGMLLNLGSACGGLLFVVVALRAAMPRQMSGVPPRTERRHWLGTTAPIFLVNSLNTVIQRTDMIMVGSLLGATAAGIYAPAGRVATVIAFGLTAVNAWAAPLIADMHTRQDHAGLQRLARLAAQGIFVFTLPLFIVVFVFGAKILSIFGPAYTAGYGVLVVLASGQLVNAAVGPVGFLLVMTGRQNTAARIMGVHAVVNVGLSAALIPSLGILGAAIASTITRISWNITMAIAVWRSMGIRAMIV